MSIQDFTDRSFADKRPEHRVLHTFSHNEGDWDDPMYDWEYFGHEKYGRYAVCKNTGLKRRLTMGEFYGTSSVD